MKLILKISIYGFLMVVLLGCREHANTTDESIDVKTEILTVFAKVYGYVKYFHPSDEASSIDWNRFAIYGVQEIEQCECKSEQELINLLYKLFRPIAPTIEFSKKNETHEYDFSKITPNQIENFEITFWQHIGVEPTYGKNKHMPYRSLRNGRGEAQNGNLELFDQKLEFGELIEREVGFGIVCQIPQVLYFNSEHTFPKADFRDFTELQNILENVRSDASDLHFRIGNVMTLYNLIQHFYPYLNLIDSSWEEHFAKALLRCYEDESETEHIITLQKFTAPLRDGHITFSTKEHSSSLFEGSWSAYVLPVNWEWVENKLVITKVHDKRLPIKIGDVVTAINHDNPQKYFKEVYSRISAGNRGWLEHKANTLSLLNKKDTGIVVTINNENFELNHDKNIYESEQILAPYLPDRLYINDSVTYINMSRLIIENFEGMMGRLRRSKAIICDLRGYPTSGIHKMLSHLLKERDTARGYMKIPKILYPDQENIVGYDTRQLSLKTTEPYLGDKEIIFITDGSAISYSETIMLYIKGYELGTIVGQPTAGTDGNKNRMLLAGGISFEWTGMKMVKLDGSQLHGIGIIPDIYVHKTIEGIKSGSDEFLEKAIQLANDAN